MVRLSKYKVKETVSQRIFELLFEVMGKHNNRDVFFSVLFDVLSPTEQLMVAKRIAAMYLIQKQIDYTVICDVLKISTATVAKYTLLLERSRGIKKALTALIQHDKINLIFRDFLASLNGPGSYGINWKSAHKIRQEIEREKAEGV